MPEIYSHVAIQFLISLCLQIFIWRWAQSRFGQMRYQMLWLFVLFAFLPLFVFVWTQNADQLVLSLALGGAYIMSFPAAAAQSPTILLIDLLSRNGPMQQSDLLAALKSEVSLVGDRVADLRNDGLANFDGAGVSVSPIGRALGHLFILYRKCLGLPRGDG